LEQQTATAEVLGVINSSPGNLQPVFEAMLDRAMRLCEASFGAFMSFDGAHFHRVAQRGLPSELVEENDPLPPRPGGALAQIVAGKRLVHIDDLADTEFYRAGYSGFIRLVDRGGARTAIWVALRKDDTLLGTAVIYRQQVRPFSDKQVALLENFAAQAVIAMENARLITETREALEQQTATAEVLGVINASPGDLGPVFETILDKARALCGIALASLHLREDGTFRAVASRGVAEPLAELLRQPYDAPPNSPPSRLLAGERVVHIDDMVEDVKQRPEAERGRVAAAHGMRTVLFVPLRQGTELYGFITAYRQELRPYTENQIALLENFAAQAVIAMANARLMNETRDALEQQTATAEVLQVINASPGDLKPVFEAMLEKATRLCGAGFGSLWINEGE
jgi:GAF domain-containing protein